MDLRGIRVGERGLDLLESGCLRLALVNAEMKLRVS
jgi:hypothetical protein